MPETLFISDLHLDRERPHILRLFEHFLKHRARGADALYILGDLFEHWLGDDDPARGLKPVIQGLMYLTEQNVPAYFLHGNRDFLVGNDFARRTGCKILPESCVIDLYGQRTLIMHGDTLCTDDVAYQRFRRKTRNKMMQRLLLSLSIQRRQSIAAYLRNKSRSETGKKSMEIMDVNQQAVVSVMQQHSLNLLIHGHTHRPAIHNFSIDDQPVTRIVLGDWYEQGSLLSCTADGYCLEEIPDST